MMIIGKTMLHVIILQYASNTRLAGGFQSPIDFIIGLLQDW